MVKHTMNDLTFRTMVEYQRKQSQQMITRTLIKELEQRDAETKTILLKARQILEETNNWYDQPAKYQYYISTMRVALRDILDIKLKSMKDEQNI